MSVSRESMSSESVHQDLLMQDQLRSANERLNVSYEHVFLEWKYTESHGGILLQIWTCSIKLMQFRGNSPNRATELDTLEHMPVRYTRKAESLSYRKSAHRRREKIST